MGFTADLLPAGASDVGAAASTSEGAAGASAAGTGEGATPAVAGGKEAEAPAGASTGGDASVPAAGAEEQQDEEEQKRRVDAAESLKQEGNRLYGEGRYDEAKAKYQEAISTGGQEVGWWRGPGGERGGGAWHKA